VAAGYGGFYASHVRGMARPIVDAASEAIRVGKEAGLPVQLSHLNPGYPSWKQIPQLIGMLEAARKEDLDVSADTLLYTQSIFSAGSLLPNWANEGGLPALLQRLQQPETRQRIKADTLRFGDEKGGSVASCLLQEGKWDLLWLTKPERFKTKNLAEVAALTGHADPYEALLDLILAEKGAIRGISQPYCQEDIDLTVMHPLCMPGSDDQPVSRSGPVAPWHRRGYGSFARLLGWYVRERGLLPLETAIAKSTSQPAQRLKLAGRGLVQEGYFADLVVFDPDAIRDVSSDDDPACYPEGIEHVLVDGQFVVESGASTPVRSGKVLRHIPGSQDFIF
jgi:N-acyl-D-aspartate/D-glutamate deacylase